MRIAWLRNSRITKTSVFLRKGDSMKGLSLLLVVLAVGFFVVGCGRAEHAGTGAVARRG